MNIPYGRQCKIDRPTKKIESFSKFEKQWNWCECALHTCSRAPLLSWIRVLKGDYPMAEAYYEHAISIPIYPELSISDQDYVAQSINQAVI